MNSPRSESQSKQTRPNPVCALRLPSWPPASRAAELGSLGRFARLQKLAERPEMDATVLALAGLSRLHFAITPDGRLTGESVPEGVLAVVLSAGQFEWRKGRSPISAKSGIF